MSKMTATQLQKRKAELKKMVHAEIVRREVMQFRLEPENIEKLYQVAVKKRRPVGTLVREWVTEKINNELEAAGKVKSIRSSAGTQELSITELQKPLEELKERISIFEAAARRIERMQAKHR
jgi:hypothetical protein